MYKAMSNHTVVRWGGKKFQLRGGTQNQGVRQRGMSLDSDSDQDIIQKVLEAPLVWHEYFAVGDSSVEKWWVRQQARIDDLRSKALDSVREARQQYLPCRKRELSVTSPMSSPEKTRRPSMEKES